MKLREDRRGQAIWVGFVLLLAILIIAFAGYQAYQVPQQNAAVEFEHNQHVQEDLQELRNAIYNARGIDTVRSTNVRLGTRYPTRILAINPPPPSGTLETVDPEQDVTLDNANLVEGTFTPAQETAIQNDILNEPHETRLLTYTPSYAEYRNPPETTYEHSLLYNRFTDANRDLAVTGQQLIDGDQINLVLLKDDYQQQGTAPVSIDPTVLSGPTQDIQIEQNGAPIRLTIPTRSPGLWTELIAEEPNAEVIDNTTDSVEIELTGGPYTLRVAAVGLDGGDSETTFDIAPPPGNVTAIQEIDPVYNVTWQRSAMAAQSPDVTQVGDRIEVVEGTDPISGIVEVRERDGEPIADATIDFGTNDRDTMAVGASTDETDTNGIGTTELTIGNVEETRLFAAAGDDVATLDVAVVEAAYQIGSVDATAAGGNSIDVTVDISTTDPTAKLRIESLRADGSVRDSLEVDPAADGTYTVSGANQATDVRVTLLDGNDVSQDSLTVAL